MKKKYTNKSGKRIIRTCENCKEKFETLFIKVNAGGEKFCSIFCYNDYRAKNKKKRNKKFDHKMYQKKYKYGLSKEDYINLLNVQENKCKICLEKFKSTDRYNSPCVDHCHDTGKVRGLLCHSCNKALGGFKDNIELLENAILYLKKMVP